MIGKIRVTQICNWCHAKPAAKSDVAVVFRCGTRQILNRPAEQSAKCRHRLLVRRAWRQRAEIRRLKAEIDERREESLCASEALVATRLWAAEMVAAGKPVVQVAAECGLTTDQVHTIMIGMKLAASGVVTHG